MAAMAAIALGFGGAAFAQQAAPAQGAQKSMPPPATVYEDEVSQRKFADSPEVMALQAQPAQRGDIYWKNDSGQTVFKQSELGALTSFVDDSENGAPASVVAYAPTLGPPAVPASLDQKRKAAAAALTKLAGREVTVFLGELNGSERWASEALDVALIGVQEADGPAGQGANKLKAVRLERARAATVSFKDGDLVLGVNPDEGYNGRPSSDAISKAITQARSTG
jgi:hypothetical protein